MNAKKVAVLALIALVAVAIASRVPAIGNMVFNRPSTTPPV